MRAKRFFAGNINYPSDTEVVICGDEYNHAKNVLRLEEGAEIVLLGGDGKEYDAIVSKVAKGEIIAHITGILDENREPEKEIYLLCGLLKGDKTELVIQKAVELGASKIGIFISGYCSAFINDKKAERFQKIAREAAKQCLRAKAPEIFIYCDFLSALSSCTQRTKLFFCEFESESQMPFDIVEGSVALVVGSEGGFSKEEYALAKDMGFKGMTLGKRILRAETAAIAATALSAYFLGELK